MWKSLLCKLAFWMGQVSRPKASAQNLISQTHCIQPSSATNKHDRIDTQRTVELDFI